jgi:hypothetical protein
MIAAPSRLAFRTRPLVPSKRISPFQSRLASDDTIKRPFQANPGGQPSGANESKLPHVTEEQAAMDKVMGEEPPQIEEQGTPVQDVRGLQSDQDQEADRS